MYTTFWRKWHRVGWGGSLAVVFSSLGIPFLLMALSFSFSSLSPSRLWDVPRLLSLLVLSLSHIFAFHVIFLSIFLWTDVILFLLTDSVYIYNTCMPLPLLNLPFFLLYCVEYCDSALPHPSLLPGLNFYTDTKITICSTKPTLRYS